MKKIIVLLIVSMICCGCLFAYGKTTKPDGGNSVAEKSNAEKITRKPVDPVTEGSAVFDGDYNK